MAKRSSTLKVPMPAEDSLNPPTTLDLFIESVDSSLFILCATYGALSAINEKHGLKISEAHDGEAVKATAAPVTTIGKLEDIKFRLSSIAQDLKDEVELNNRL